MSKPKQGTGRNERLGEIVRVFCRYSLADWFEGTSLHLIREHLVSPETRAILDLPVGERLRLALTELGTTFIKLGQVLSTRADLVGLEVADELRKLQADTPADAPASVEQTIREELGKDPGEMFREFEPEAFSSASIGQVHKARLADGRLVVVKVQHAGIREKVELDLGLLEELAALVEKHSEEARAYQPVAVARDFRRTLLRELDFTSERRHMETFARNFAKDETVHVPDVHRELCSRRVLTMEKLEGTPGSKTEKIRASGMPLDEFAKRAANVFLNMIFRDGFYHADPHPGNFMLLEGEVLGLLDCGMVGHIDEPLRETFENLLLLLLQGDSEGLADLLLRVGKAPEDVDRDGFRSDLGELIMDYGTQSLEDLDLGGALNALAEIIRRYCIRVPSSASLMLKTLVMLEGTSRVLSPTFSLAELLAPIKEKLIRERLDPRRWLRRLPRTLSDLDRLARHAPRQLADILEGLQTGKLKIRHEHQQLVRIADRLVAGLLVASLFIGSCMLLIQDVPPHMSGFSMPGSLGSLIAVILGGRILWTIRKRLQ